MWLKLNLAQLLEHNDLYDIVEYIEDMGDNNSDMN